MTKEELIQAISDDKMMPFIQPEQLAGIVDFVIKNYKPSLPSKLDEAAIDAAQLDMQDRQIMEATNEERLRYSRIFRRGFKAGAEWMAGQGETQEHFVIGSIAGSPCGPAIVCYTEEFAIGDEVIIQIRKK